MVLCIYKYRNIRKGMPLGEEKILSNVMEASHFHSPFSSSFPFHFINLSPPLPDYHKKVELKLIYY